ncbi:hypothetical protein [Halobaculum sp. EA56]|uniref:hypothetical protein n=1 Tax=Halobaculum sp. EA56 TaxID=3421648 RepID=UPI003EBEFAF9
MRQPISSIFLIAIVLITGCAGIGDQASNQPNVTKTDTNAVSTANSTGTSVPSTSDATSTMSRTTSQRRANLPAELELSGPADTATNVSVSLKYESNGTRLFGMDVRLEPDVRIGIDYTFPRSGTYLVTVSSEGKKSTYEWDIGSRDPDTALSIDLTENGEIEIVPIAA